MDDASQIVEQGTTTEVPGLDDLTPAVEEVPEYRKIKHKVKIEGQELEVPYEQLVADYQLGKVSRKKMEEAARLRDEAYTFIDSAKKDGLKFLKNVIPEDQLIAQAYEVLKQSVEYAELPEEQKELQALRRELEQYKKEKETVENTQSQMRREQEELQAIEWLDNKMSSTVEGLRNKYGNIVGTGIANEIARQLEAYELALEDGEDSEIPDIDAISDKVWNKWKKSTFGYLSSLPVDALKEALSKEQLKALRKMDLDAALSSLPQTRRTPTETPSQTSQPKQYKSFDDQFEEVIKQRTRGI